MMIQHFAYTLVIISMIISAVAFFRLPKDLESTKNSGAGGG
jgi:hypothetical protein